MTSPTKGKVLVGRHYFPKHHRYTTAIVVLSLIALSGVCNFYGQQDRLDEANLQYQFDHFKVSAFESSPSAQVVVEKTVSQKEIEQEIKDVFGSHAEKAFKVLNCENKALNPNAVHPNNDKVKSTDYGVFQINDHWQGVSNVQFLKDPHINIRMAWRIYVNSGYNFHLWSCGKKLGV